MQVQFLNKVFYKIKTFFVKLKYFFHHIFFSTLIGLSALFLALPHCAYAGNVLPPVAALSDSIQSHAHNFDEFGLNGYDDDLQNQNLALTSDMFGVSGPLSFNITVSDPYGLILNAQYTRLFNDKNAYSIQADLGPKTNRLNLTLGHNFSLKNRMKLSVERLAQKQSFDFNSGTIDHWVSQYAGGAQFQHLLGEGILNNLAVGGYYARALDKTLDSVIYNDASGDPWINYRHIAGATSKGFNTSLGVRPWKTGILTLTGYYDWVHYHNIYANVSASDSQEFGFGISLNQYLSKSMQGNFSYTHRAVYKTLEAGIQWIHNIFHQTRSIAISLSGSHSSSDNVSRDNSVTVGLQYYFAPVTQAYRIPEFQMDSLKTWTSQPAVHMDQVIVAADQMNEKVTISWNNKKMLTFTTIRSNGHVDENIHREEATINVKDSDLEYFLTVEEMSSAPQALNQANNRVVDGEPMVDQDFVKHDVKTDVQHHVTLLVRDKKTGAFNQYDDYFQVSGDDEIIWPKDFTPSFTYVDMDGENTVHGYVSIAAAKSTKGYELYYTVKVYDADDKTTPIDTKEHMSSDELENGIELHKLRLLGHYFLMVSAQDEHGTQDERKTEEFEVRAEDTVVGTISNATFSWTDSKYPAQGGTFSWKGPTKSAQGKPVCYNLLVTQGDNTIVNESGLKTLSYTMDSSNGLLPNTSAQIQIEATLEKGSSSQNYTDNDYKIPAATMIGNVSDFDFTPVNSDPNKINEGITVSWTSTFPEFILDKPVTTTIKLMDKDGSVIGKATGVTGNTYTFKQNENLLPGKKYNVEIVKTNPYCNDSTFNFSFTTKESVEEWNKWDGNQNITADVYLDGAAPTYDVTVDATNASVSKNGKTYTPSKVLVVCTRKSTGKACFAPDEQQLSSSKKFQYKVQDIIGVHFEATAYATVDGNKQVERLIENDFIGK